MITTQVSLIIVITVVSYFISYRRKFHENVPFLYQITLFLFQIPCMLRIYVDLC